MIARFKNARWALLVSRCFGWLGWLLVLWLVAGLSWRLWLWWQPLPTPDAVLPPAPALMWPSQLDTHWSRPTQAVARPQAPVQPSRLSIQLQGLFLSDEPQRSVVLLRYRQRDYVLSPGDELEAGLVLEAIQPEALIFVRDGQRESVAIDWRSTGPEVIGPASDTPPARVTTSRLATSQPSAPPAARPALPQAAAEAVSAAPLIDEFGPDFRQRLLNDPLQLMRYITLVPVQQEGQLYGFRLNPGSQRALFEQLGLQPGDLLVSVDGQPVNNTAAMMRLPQQLRDARSVDLIIEREGQQRPLRLEME